MAASQACSSSLQWPRNWEQSFPSRGTGATKFINVRLLGNSTFGHVVAKGSKRMLTGEGVNSRRTVVACSPGEGKDEVVKPGGDEDISRKVELTESKGVVEKIEDELGRQFGGFLWFSILIVCLAFFGGGYAYFIFNYANFDDIPILRGPIR